MTQFWILDFRFRIKTSERKRLIRLVLCTALFALCPVAEAQPPGKIAQVGYLSLASGPARREAVLNQSLHDLGWIEGKNIVIHYRWSAGKLDRLPFLAAEFDVAPEQGGKNLELLYETAPKASRVAILRHPKLGTHVAYSKEAEKVAKKLQVTVQFAEVQASKDTDLEDAFGAIVRERAEALLVFASSFFADRRPQIVSFAARKKLPAIYPGSPFVDAGGLMSYGATLVDL